MRREKEKKGREKEEEFRQHCYRNSSAQNAAWSVKKKQLRQCHCQNTKKKICSGNCGNAIAENGKKKLWNLWMSKKNSYHVHDIFTIFSQ